MGHGRPLSVLIVDEDVSVRRMFTDLIAAREEVDVRETGDPEEALNCLRVGDCDVAFVGMRIRGRRGMELLAQAKRDRPGVEVVMVTADRAIESAMEAARLGAADFLSKPVEPDQVSLILSRVRRILDLQSENERLNRELRELENEIERARALGRGDRIEPEHLSPDLRRGTTRRRRTEPSLEEMEIGSIRRLLGEHAGDTARVASVLKIDRSTLYRKIKRYRIRLR